MPPVKQAPSTNGTPHDPSVSPLKLFEFHGLDLRPAGSNQVVGECPFCGKEKFHVNESTGLWDCKVCGEKGNNYGFLRALHKAGAEQTSDADLAELAVDRGIVYGESLRAWGVAKSPVTGEWLVPGWGVDGKLNQLYKYVLDGKTKKRRLYASPGIGQYMAGVNLYEPKKPDTILCEGVWDGIALWESLRSAKSVDGALHMTGAESSSLLASVNVLTVPGCQSFPEVWGQLLHGKRVTLMYDSDHPRQVNGKTIEPAGWLGMKKVAGTLAVSEWKPETVSWLAWGPDGFDPHHESGTDVRDLLRSGGAETVKDRIENLAGLLKRVEPIPDSWVAGKDKKAAKGKLEIAAIPCDNWKTVVNALRRCMQSSANLEGALAFCLAVNASTNSVGDQLWGQLLSPPSTGKSTLAEAMSINTRHIVAKSTIRGMHSGFQTDADGKEDHSLLSKLNGKTLIIKDGDTLLKSPNLPQILSEMRDVYDRVSRTSYRNKASRDYIGVSTTIIICGTGSMREMDTSELGERFLKYSIMDGIDPEMERDIVRKVLFRQSRIKGTPIDEVKSLNEPDMTKFMQLVSGYIDHLAKWANPLLQKVDDESEEALERLGALAVFVSYLRARPSPKQVESVERELAARLASQLHRLATCLAVVLNKTSLDEEVMRLTAKVAMDTSKGRTLEIVHTLFKYGEQGIEAKSLSIMTAQSEAEERNYLKFLKKLGAVEVFANKVAGVQQRPRWRLTPVIVDLYREILQPKEEVMA